MVQNAKKIWSQEDKEYLLESYGIVSMRQLMRKLKRSEEAIKQKYRDLTGTLDMSIAGGFLSPREVANALGVDNRTVMDWIYHHNLPTKQLNRIKDDDTKQYRNFLDSLDVWKWISKNKDRINFSQVKRGILLPEPKWLDEAVTRSTYQKRSTNWTIEEDETAWFMWNSGVNYREIASRLNRPEKGTQRRLTVIRKKKNKEHTKTN